ncbi:hypothetical protein AZSI13_21970 [Azospira sp. I13]|uniref:cache domain-containing sensor histidine kinase n=1 Tax=Azospira sp. I13 TaxID=1765050 RepID=UPI000D42FEE6|nr:ATP-binding protein [Azospira sp. I13]GBG02870.1 hypothetical protein AZSI13_21970 [Azospira sp. I13]
MPSSTPTTSRQGLRLVWAFALAVLLLNWFAVFFKIDSEERLEVAAVNQNNLNLARALEEHTLRTLKSVDQAVMFLKYQYEHHPDRLDIPAYVRDGMIFANLFNQLGIIDARGMYIHSNLPNHKVMDLSDREHFRVHQASDSSQLFISQPVLGRATGKWSLQLTRRINKPDGSFGGVAVVSLDPLYFTQLYGDVDLGAGGVITLVGLDGVVRARRSDVTSQVGQKLMDSPLLTAAARDPRGTLTHTSSIDGVERFLAYRVLPDYPLMVVVGVGKQQALAAVHGRARSYLLFGTLVTFIVLAFAWAIQVLLLRLEKSRARAEESNRLKSEFLASMSHELRTPLNGIIGYAELLQDGEGGPEQVEYAQTIRQSGTHLLELVNSILDLAKIEAGQLTLHPAATPLSPLLQQVLASHQPMAVAKGLTLSLATAENLPQTLWCDALRLTQVLNNLVHNAVKFTVRGSILIEVIREGAGIRFAVVDTGPGIALEDQEAVFEKFRQAETFATRRQGGSGLGLALSRQLVDHMGGNLQLRSQTGRGSEFFFVLPLPDKETP